MRLGNIGSLPTELIKSKLFIVTSNHGIHNIMLRGVIRTSGNVQIVIDEKTGVNNRVSARFMMQKNRE
eukprot:1058078-Karenia_brevis.AAC.1